MATDTRVDTTILAGLAEAEEVLPSSMTTSHRSASRNRNRLAPRVISSGAAGATVAGRDTPITRPFRVRKALGTPTWRISTATAPMTSGRRWSGPRGRRAAAIVVGPAAPVCGRWSFTTSADAGVCRAAAVA